MKRLLCALALCLLAVPAFPVATNKYVDSGCTNNGDGSALDCAASPGGAGPWNRLDLATFACDTIINVRGIHSTHGSNHAAGTTDGRYFGNEYAISAACTSGTPATIQTFGYVSSSSQGERVYLDGTRCPHPASCASCDATTCAGQDAVGMAWENCDWDGTACDCAASSQNVTIGAGGQTACEETWFAVDNGTAGTGFQAGSASTVRMAQKTDGSPTYRLAAGTNTSALTGLTNAHGSYNNKRCSTDTWHPCDVAADCPGSQTCTATSAEIDSWTDTDDSVIYVRWGTGANAPGGASNLKPYVSYGGAGDAFAFKSSGPAAWWTVRGNFALRAHSKSSIYVGPGTNNITFDGITVAFSHCGTNCDGSSRGFDFELGGSGPHTIRNSEILITSDEGIKAAGKTGAAATDYDITSNWIHMLGRESEVGPSIGTPSGILFGDDTANADTGNFAGSVISGNLIEKLEQSSGSPAYGLRWEHSVSNTIVRDNVIRNTEGAPCMVLDGSSGTAAGPWNTDSNQIFNNIMTGCGQNGLNVFCGNAADATQRVRDNLIYNNTIYDVTNREFNQDTTAGATCTGNKIRNNIFADPDNEQVVLWVTPSGNSNAFQNNTTYSTSGGTVVSWGGTTFTCGQVITSANVDGDAGADSNKCEDPAFVSTTDFHLLTASPAKDAGTSTGMPAARTTDINNTITSAHGLPAYNDGQSIQNGIWDMGVDEFGGSAPVLAISKTESQDPIAPTATLTYTIAYQNTGTASATGVVITDTVPTNTTFSSATAGGSLGGGVVTWTIGTVAAGASASVQLLVTVNSPLSDGTILTNGTYSIASNELPTVNGAAVTTTVTSQPVLTISKTDTPDPVTPGSTTITYTLAYSNTGTANATTTVISDTVPAGTTFQSATGGGSHAAGVVTWNIGTVNAGTSSSVQMTVTANSPLQNGTVIHNNTYSIDCDQTAAVAGVDDTTTVSVPQVAGGLQYPYNARATTWPAAQTWNGGGSFAGTVDFAHNYAMNDPTPAPTAAQGPTTGGICTNAGAPTYRTYVSWQNKTGKTNISAASNDVTVSTTTSRITVTRPLSIPSEATEWDAWWSSSADGHAAKRGCNIAGTENNSSPSVSTFDCQCRTGTSAPSSNGTRSLSGIKFVTDYITRPEIAVKEVCATGCEYTSVGAALTAITDAAATKRYVVYVRAPYEEASQISSKSYVSIVGESKSGSKLGIVNLVAGITDFSLHNLRLTNVHITGDGAGNIVRLSNLFIGTAASPSAICFDDSAGGYTVFADNVECYASQYGVGIGITTRWVGNGNYINMACSGTSNCPCWWVSSTINDPRDGGDLSENGAVCDLTTGNSSGDVSGLKADTSSASSAAPVGAKIRLMSPTIRVTSTNTTTTSRVGCYLLGPVIANSNPSFVEVDDGRCEVTAAGSTATVFGLAIDSDADHSTWSAALRGGRIILSGGTSQTDVINADTGLTPVLSSVVHAGVYSGAGTVAAGDTRLGAFTSRLIGPVSDVGSTCIKGQIMPDDGGATDELCVCIATNTVKCVTLGNTNPVD